MVMVNRRGNPSTQFEILILVERTERLMLRTLYPLNRIEQCTGIAGASHFSRACLTAHSPSSSFFMGQTSPDHSLVRHPLAKSADRSHSSFFYRQNTHQADRLSKSKRILSVEPSWNRLKLFATVVSLVICFSFLCSSLTQPTIDGY